MAVLPQFEIQLALRQRSAFAVQHLMAAARFSRQCGEIERINEGSELGSFYDEQKACVSASIMLSVASLESNINEHLVDSDTLLAELPSGARKQLNDLLSRRPILEKYERVLGAKDIQPFDQGVRPYQDVDILVAVRNELVHFHPEWHDEQERHRRLGERLKDRFELSPFISEKTGVLFPQRIVSHGCTKWAVQSSLAFMECFAEKVGLPSRFEQYMDRLSV